ncbi:MAG: HAD family phosphatase [Armatimonadetes bacterium]|nr:HAD family phosphatase [Armatimonadota bacterium]
MDHRVYHVDMGDGLLPAAALIFDMDGLLLDTEVLYVKATRAVVEPYGHTVDMQVYADWVGREVTEADFQRAFPIPLTYDEVWRRLRAEYFRLCAEELTLRSGVAEFLAGAARDYPKAVASSTPLPIIEQQLAQVGLLEQFSVRVSARDCPRGKPHPDVFEAAARQLGATPAACVVFEDSPHGVAGALAAGMRAVAVPTELTAHCPFAGAHLRVARLTEVTAAWLGAEPNGLSPWEPTDG